MDPSANKPRYLLEFEFKSQREQDRMSNDHTADQLNEFMRNGPLAKDWRAISNTMYISSGDDKKQLMLRLASSGIHLKDFYQHFSRIKINRLQFAGDLKNCLFGLN